MYSLERLFLKTYILLGILGSFSARAEESIPRLISFDQELKSKLTSIQWTEDSAESPSETLAFAPINAKDSRLDKKVGYIWYRFELNTPKEGELITLRHPAVLAMKFKLFVQTKEGYTPLGRDVKDNLTSLYFEAKGGPHTYYLRLKSHVGRLDLEFWSSDGIRAHQRMDDWIFGSLIYTSAITAILSFFLAFVFRYISFFLYGLASLATGFFFSSQAGILRFFLPDEIFMAHYQRLFLVSSSAFIFFSGIYLYHFLGIGERQSIIAKLGARIIIGFSAALTFLFLFDLLPNLSWITHVLTVLGAGYVVAFIPGTKRDTETTLIIAGWIALISHAILFILYVRGIVDSSWYNARSLYIGVILQNILYNCAILFRVDRIRKSENAARLHQKIEAESRMEVQSLLHVLCHDMGNPLMVASGNSELLMRAVDKESPTARRIKRVSKAIESMTQIMDLVRNQEAVRTGKKKLDNSVKTSIKQAFADAVKMFDEKLSEKSLKIVAQDVRDDLTLQIDPTMFVYCILSNIISNAIKYTPKGGEIRLSTGTEGTKVWIEVADTGPGIPEDILKNLFDESKPTNRVGSEGELGTGFGTLQIKRYTETSGGTVSVTSRTERPTGTKFRLTFEANNGKQKLAKSA